MKTLKIIQIVLLLILFVGLVTVMVVVISGKISIGGFLINGKSVEVFNEEFDAGNVNNIVVDVSSADVKVCYSDSEQFKVVYQGAEKEIKDPVMTAEIKSDSLLIKQTNKITWFQWGVNRIVTIYVPESFKGKFDYTCSSGDLAFLDDFSFSDIKSKSTSGDMSAGNLTCGQFMASCSSGDINIGTLQTDDFSFKLTSGDISVAELHGAGKLELTSGDMTIQGFYGQGSFETSSGDVILEICEATGDVTIKVTSGEVTVDIIEDIAFLCDFSVTSGDIQTVFDSGTGTYSKNFNGSIGENPVNTLKINTTSGDILVKG